ncbi:MAG: type II toxin-antitoxin system RelE/ParE family toxin [Lachnospiraceae bacterium]|nr:type II toxin-antitoxin system RelE/ParE family toxin [Lachnospiraceae bacterium]
MKKDMNQYLARTFILTDEFSKRWEKLGLTDDDQLRLKLEILNDPEIGKVIPGNGKLRKMRFAFKNRGKSGSTRVCYVDFVVQETIYLITVYAKNEKDNLTQEERNTIKKMIQALEQTL